MFQNSNFIRKKNFHKDLSDLKILILQSLVKISKFQKQIFLFSLEPKTERKGSKMGQMKRNYTSIVLNTPN